MTDPGAARFVVQSVALDQLDAAAVSGIQGVIPDDALRAKRLANLARARQVVVAWRHGRPVGLVFVRTLFGIPNVTWLVAPEARRQGLAVRMLRRLQEDWCWLTAVCRNAPSVGVARGAGFVMLGPCAVWMRGPR